jgi:ribonuclease HI
MADELNPAPLPLARVSIDGSCVGNPGPGGWAIIVDIPETDREYRGCGREPDETTNPRMELQAAIEGLRRLPGAHRVDLATHSKYLLDGINEGLAKWRRSGQLQDGSIPNADLWRELDELLHLHKVLAVYVADPKRHPMLRKCDRMAGEMAGRRSKR